MVPSIFIYDDVNVDLIPADAEVVAAYAGGIYENLGQARQKFPKAIVISIAISASEEAEVLDIENGDATVDQAPGWVKWQHSRGISLPILYRSVNGIDELVSKMTAAGIPRNEYWIWSAHYGIGSHVCGPNTCKLTKYGCDATQFTDHAHNESLDESVTTPEFVPPTARPPVPVPPPVHVPPRAVIVKIDGQQGTFELEAGKTYTLVVS
jgi:hypothetical protein